MRSRKPPSILARARAASRAFTGGPIDPATSRPLASTGGAFAATSDLGALPPHLNNSNSGPVVDQLGLRRLRNMSRGFTRNGTLMGAYTLAMLNNTIGPRSPTPDWDDAAVSEEDRKVLQDKWQSWLRAPVGAGSLPGREVLRKALRHTIVDGDVLLLPFKSPNGRVGFNYYLGDEFDDSKSARQAQTRGAFIQNGVEVDARTGIVRGYWVRSAGDPGRSHFVSAFDSIHLARPDNFKSYRGLPWGTPAFDALLHISIYDDAELKKLGLGAMVFTALTSDVDTYSADTSALKRGFERDSGGAGDPTAELRMKPGELMKLPPGYQVAPIEVGPRSLGQMEFRTRKVNEVCAVLGIMPARMTGSFDQVNFSASRQAAAVEQRQYRDVQQWLITALLEPIFALLVSDAIAEGLISDRAVLDRVIMRPKWRFSGWPSTEIHRELPSLIGAVDNGLISRAMAGRIIGDNDPSDVARDLAREREEFMRVGIWDDLASNRAAAIASQKAGATGGRPPGGTGN